MKRTIAMIALLCLAAISLAHTQQQACRPLAKVRP
jgi:predicted small secreted protein